MQEDLDLADWRRRVGELYRLESMEAFRVGKDDLFRSHPQSPIPPERRATFPGLSYFAPDASYRVAARLEPPADPREAYEIDTGGEDGIVRYRRAGVLHFKVLDSECRLTLFRQLGYGGGLFLPFADALAGKQTYGGGRYLADTVKNTHGRCLEITAGSPEVGLDFNYAYNPSCAYDVRWACPLAPPENRLRIPVPAGEKSYSES